MLYRDPGAETRGYPNEVNDGRGEGRSHLAQLDQVHLQELQLIHLTVVILVHCQNLPQERRKAIRRECLSAYIIF